MTANIGALSAIHEQVKELNRQNNRLRAKYQGDAKYTRIHKRLLEHGTLSETERSLFEALSGVKQLADNQVVSIDLRPAGTEQPGIWPIILWRLFP